MGNLNYSELQKRMTLFFDNALCESDKKELLDKVDCDPDFCELFEKEKSVRDFIKNKVTRPPVTTDFIQSIKDSINIS